MDAFQRAGERKRVADLSPARVGCGEAENRSQPFAAGKKTVTHRSVQRRGFRNRFRQVAVERALDQFLARDEICFDVHDSECSLLALARYAGLIIRHRASRIQHRVWDAMR